MREVLANAEGGAFGEDQIEQDIPPGRGAEDRQQHAWPLFLHLDGGSEDIHGAGGEEFLGQGTDQFRGGVVNIGFQHQAFVGGGAGGGGFEERGAQEVGAAVQLAMTEAMAGGADDGVGAG